MTMILGINLTTKKYQITLKQNNQKTMTLSNKFYKKLKIIS
jgi:hypothetical protein